MLITHDLGVVAEVADDVAVMYLGKVIEAADVFTLFKSPKHPYTQALLRSIPRVDRPAGERLAQIRGMVPNPFFRPDGCSFNPRCPKFLRGVCDRVHTGTDALPSGNLVRCLQYDPAHAHLWRGADVEALEPA